MSRMKAMSEAQSQAKKRVPDCIPTKDPYYPSATEGFEVIDKRCLDILSVEDQDKLWKMLNTLRTEHTTRAISTHIDNLESKLISTAEKLEAYKGVAMMDKPKG